MAGALHPDPLADGGGAPDEAPDDRFRSIGEASVETGVKPHILRYWEECFSQLRPIKRAGGRRYYRRDDLDLIRHIDDLVNRRGYTFSGARSVLAGKDAPPPLSSAPSDLTAHQRQGLLELRGDLSAMLAAVRQR